MLALLASPGVALAEPVYSMSFSPAGFEATAMNNTGGIIGWRTDETADRVPFIYPDGTMRHLGTIDGHSAFGEAKAIDNAGMVVGWAQTKLVDGADGWTVVEAYDINDAQQILGKACRRDECLSVRLDLVAAVPEPGGYAMLAAGLALLAGRRKWGGRESLRFS